MPKAKSKTESAAVVTKPVEVSAELRAVLIGPRLSEKAVKLSETGKYIFRVMPSANKVQVKKAIEKTYKVNVVQVNMILLRGKKRNFGKTMGRVSDLKKAIVTLKEGQKIEGAMESV